VFASVIWSFYWCNCGFMELVLFIMWINPWYFLLACESRIDAQSLVASDLIPASFQTTEENETVNECFD